jgi:N-acetyl-anhydromuramyl-L-alanine amidase AmpD
VPRVIRAVVWHDMEGWLPGALARWNSGLAGAHLCILKDGTVVLTCKLEDVAWHAGTNDDPTGGTYGRTPFWRKTNLNPYSVGVELEGWADGRDGGYTEAQIQSAIRVAKALTAQFRILPRHTFDQVDGHHLHAEISASRQDPGPRFPLDRILAAIQQSSSPMKEDTHA